MNNLLSLSFSVCIQTNCEETTACERIYEHTRDNNNNENNGKTKKNTSEGHEAHLTKYSNYTYWRGLATEIQGGPSNFFFT